MIDCTAIVDLYSDAALFAEHAEYALQCAREGNAAEALATLQRARERFGNLETMRQRFDAAIREVSP